MTPSPTLPLISRFDAANEALAGRVGRMLERRIGDRESHARLLNTLSMLEHMGCRKIMATQSGPRMEEATLRHLSEEARHALFFKRHAARAAGRSLDYSPGVLASPAEARMYFQRLDATVKRTVSSADARAAYLYMSLTVEFRALWLYRLYENLLERLRASLSLRGVLAEEEGHLEGMADRLQALDVWDPELADRLCREERRLFIRLLVALEDHVRASGETPGATRLR
jgi:hypothetical protein